MRENSDDFDLSSCLRHARRWAIALVCLLAINGSLVALAFIPRATAANVPPVVPTVAGATPVQPSTPANPPPAEPDVAPLTVAIADPPPTAPVVNVPPSEAPPVTSPPPRPAFVDTPPAVTQPANVPPNVVPPPAADSLIVANPPDIGGAVNFTVNGVVHALAPGEYVEFAGRSQRLVEFHRGDNFGYAAQQLEAGLQAFELCATGWTLKPLEAAAARKLLGACRKKPASP